MNAATIGYTFGIICGSVVGLAAGLVWSDRRLRIAWRALYEAHASALRCINRILSAPEGYHVHRDSANRLFEAHLDVLASALKAVERAGGGGDA